ncbi:MAG: pilus assembly protein PilM [Candidatus Ratteibacteria bacterium]
MKKGGRKALSIDIGSTKIRVCDLELSGQVPYISYYDEMDIPVSPAEREEFINFEAKNFIKKQRAKAFYVSLPGRGVLVRSLTVPKVPIKKLKDILKYEVQQQIPFPLEMVEWKYQIISETDQNYNILLGAVKKDIITDFLSRLTMFGIDPLFLDIDLFSILNLFTFSPNFSSEKCQAILEVGATSSNFIVLHREKMLIRSLTTSGDTITNVIAEAESISYAEAEGKKITGKSMEIPSVKTTVESLHTEIQNSIDYWRFTQKGPEVEEIYLCGRGILLEGFKEFIQEKARIPVFNFNAFSNIEISDEYAHLRSSGTELTVLLGTALRKLRRTTVNLDLLPEEIERVREFKYNRPYIYLSAIMAGLIAITPTLFFNQEKSMLQGILTELDISLQQYEKYKPEVDKLKGDATAIQGQVATIEKIINEKDIWLRRITTLGNALPSSRIYVVSLTPGEQEVTFAAAAVETPLQRQPVSQRPTTPSTTQRQVRQPGAQGPATDPSQGPAIDPSQGPAMPPTTQQGPARPQAAGGPPTQQGPTRPQAAGGPPGAAKQEAGQPPAEEKKQEENKVFTLQGEVIITDIKIAFSDFKTFVSKLSELDFISSATIKACEMSPQKDKLQFALLINIK